MSWVQALPFPAPPPWLQSACLVFPDRPARRAALAQGRQLPERRRKAPAACRRCRASSALKSDGELTHRTRRQLSGRLDVSEVRACRWRSSRNTTTCAAGGCAIPTAARAGSTSRCFPQAQRDRRPQAPVARRAGSAARQRRDRPALRASGRCRQGGAQIEPRAVGTHQGNAMATGAGWFFPGQHRLAQPDAGIGAPIRVRRSRIDCRVQPPARSVPNASS